MQLTKFTHACVRLDDGDRSLVASNLVRGFLVTGAFDMALRQQLPEGVLPQQVRAALTAVMRKMISAPGTFDSQGWLQVGFYGHQPAMAESYISTGSCYLCSVAWLPLGLPATDPFWAAPAAPWTGKKVWEGENIAADHAL